MYTRLSWLTAIVAVTQVLTLAPGSAQQSAGTASPQTPAASPALRQAPVSSLSGSASTRKVKTDRWTALRLANDRWFDRTALADPSIVAAVCAHSLAAQALALHPHLGNIAEADHYLCRRLTRWKKATRNLLTNPQASVVIGLDPEGIYRAIEKDPKVGRILSKNVFFDQMVADNPDLGKFIALHIK